VNALQNGTAVSESQHPAPERGKVSTGALLGALFASPVAWDLQLIVNYGLAAHACYPADVPLHEVAPGFHAARTIVLLINLLAAVLALAGAGLSYQHWRATRAEQRGDAEHAVESGEGRTRFLALWGVMAGLGFFIGILFNTLALLMVPTCAG
jgi:hypothetical protein